MAQDSGTDEVLYGIDAVDTLIAWAVGRNGTIVKTVDGGITWRFKDSGIFGILFGISAVDSDTAWAVGAANAVGTEGAILHR